MRKILSAFSLNMLSDPSCSIEVKKINKPNLDGYESFVGQPAMARHLDVECRPGRVELKRGDDIIVANANVRGLSPYEDFSPDTTIYYYSIKIL